MERLFLMAAEIVRERDLQTLMDDAQGLGGEAGVLAQVMILVGQYVR